MMWLTYPLSYDTCTPFSAGELVNSINEREETSQTLQGGAVQEDVPTLAQKNSEWCTPQVEIFLNKQTLHNAT